MPPYSPEMRLLFQSISVHVRWHKSKNELTLLIEKHSSNVGSVCQTMNPKDHKSELSI